MKYLLILSILITSVLADSIPKYKRSYFKHWVDVDKDCQKTRAEVLIRDAIDGKVMFDDNDKQCKVIFATIHDHYSGKSIPSHLADIDHFIPLKEAWRSGAWNWTNKKREDYANYMNDEWHLLAVHRSLNRSKSDRSPDKWMPPDKNFWVFYCLKWIQIKKKWGLTVTQNELNFLKTILIKQKKVIYPEVR